MSSEFAPPLIVEQSRAKSRNAPRLTGKAWSITISGAALVGAFLWVAPRAGAFAVRQFVQTDTFNLYRAQIAQRREIDSILAEAHWRRIEEQAARADTLLREIRDCQKHRSSC